MLWVCLSTAKPPQIRILKCFDAGLMTPTQVVLSCRSIVTGMNCSHTAEIEIDQPDCLRSTDQVVTK